MNDIEIRYPTRYKKFVLLDANLIAGYYLPESLDWKRSRERIKNLFESVMNNSNNDIMLYTPSVCIPEVMSVFSTYRWATWSRKVQKKFPKGISAKRYAGISEKLQGDIQNNFPLRVVPLKDSHLVNAQFIQRIDAYFEHYRGKRKNKKMMSAVDHIIISMAIELSEIHSRGKFILLTADKRMADITNRAIAMKNSTKKKLGIKMHKYAFPKVCHLSKISVKELQSFFGCWPLPNKAFSGKPLLQFNAEDGKVLSIIRQRLNVTRDKLPYTKEFEILIQEFQKYKGQKVDRNAAWLALLRHEKKGLNKRK